MLVGVIGACGAIRRCPRRSVRPDRRHRDHRGPAAVVRRVLQQVGHHAFEPALVDADVDRLHVGRDHHVGVDAHVSEVAEAGLDGPLHQFADVDLLEEDIHRAGIGPGHLEQVADHALEPAQVVAQQLQGALGTGGQLVAVRLEHLERGRQRGEGRAQFVADVGVETGLALDPGLHLVDHGVERGGQALEVGIGRLGLQPGVERPPAMATAARETPAKGRSESPAGEAAQCAVRAAW